MVLRGSAKKIKRPRPRPGTPWWRRIPVASASSRVWAVLQTLPRALSPLQASSGFLLSSILQPTLVVEGLPHHTASADFLSVFQLRVSKSFTPTRSFQTASFHAQIDPEEKFPQAKNGLSWTALISLELPGRQHSQLGKSPQSPVTTTTPRGSHLC